MASSGRARLGAWWDPATDALCGRRAMHRGHHLYLYLYLRLRRDPWGLASELLLMFAPTQGDR